MLKRSFGNKKAAAFLPQLLGQSFYLTRAIGNSIICAVK
jgi:hypothetical protein